MPRPELGRASRKSGEIVLAQKARGHVVFQLCCANGLAILAALLPPAVIAVVQGADAIAIALAPGCALAIAMSIYGNLNQATDPRRGEALVSVAASFIAAVILASPAFASLGMPPIDAVFESASGVTTTGLSMATNSDHWPYAAHFLRAWLQWIGGFAFVSAALALVVGQGVIAKRLGAAGGLQDDRAASTQARARGLLLTYVSLSAICVAAIAAAHPQPAMGALMALSAVSTGGFSPYSDSVAGDGFVAQLLVIAACVMGSISLGLWWLVLRQGPLKTLGDEELRLFGVVLLGGAASIALIERQAGGAPVWSAIFTAFSAQTTAGFSISDISSLTTASKIVLVGMMMIGGCIGATAGGIKVFRFAFVITAMRLMILRARIPASAVTYLRVFGRKTSPGEGTDVVGLLAIYGIATGVLWLTLVLSGAAALPALFDTVSALSTVGLSVGAIAPELPDISKIIATLAMLFGRLEFLALIVFLTPQTWMKD